MNIKEEEVEKPIQLIQPNPKEPEKIDKLIDYSSLQNMVLTRNDLVKILHEPYFEEITKGYFVRVSLGDNEGKRVYRLCEIDGFKDKPTSYKVDEKFTSKYLVLKYGKYTKSYSIIVISNSPVTSTEFQRWYQDSVKEKTRIPTVDEVTEKRKHYEKTKNEYVYGEDTVKEILAKKGIKISPEEKKLQLLQKKEILSDEGRFEEIEEINREIEEVDRKIENKKNKRKEKTN